jgi:hypothetical protein
VFDLEEKKIYGGKTTIKITQDVKEAQEELVKLEKEKV